MKRFPSRFFIFVVILACVSSCLGAKKIDPYKVLGVDKNASQREIQKAFHKLSLQHHPDKNKNKGAQAKFEEINNAYEILSDEEKRKNYDLYGDEMGNPGFDTGNPGFNTGNSRGHGGYTYFTGGGPGQRHFSFKPGSWQTMDDVGGSKSFSYSFGSSAGENPFGFGLDDIFSGFFGGGGRQFGGFKSSSGPQHGSRSSPKSIKAVNSQTFKKEIVDKGMTWLLLFDTPLLMNNKAYDSSLDDLLTGVLKVGRVNCEDEPAFCKDLGAYPRRAPRLFVYSYSTSGNGSLVEYKGDLGVNHIKKFCEEHLPRFSKRVEMKDLEFLSDFGSKLPKVLLLSTKKETPVIWRALSGLYHKHIDFYDTQVHDVSDPVVQKLEVDSFPAIVGWLSNGEKHVLKTGISVKDMKSAVDELSALLDGFIKKNKKASGQARKPQADLESKQIHLLSGSNYDALCGENIPLCLIGAFRSTKGKEKLESILHVVSQKSFTRNQSGSRNSISFALLDANKQSAFLTALDKSGFKTFDKILVAYKPKKGKFAVSGDEITTEAAEGFIISVLNGDVQFRKTRQKPVLT